MLLENFIEKYKKEIIKSTQDLIKIPSVSEDSNILGKPFGYSANAALEYVLDLGKTLGFRTKNIDGYCGYVEFGEGKDMLGIIGHLDVVPAGDNWIFPPFEGIIKDNCIYGRGAIDDKGPVIASLYAMKSVMENCKVKKRVRLILGLNEEKDWKCIKYYKEHEELPTIGFSPDADFPCIYAEKAILSPVIKMYYNQHNNIIIKDIDCYNNPMNVVPKICSIILEVSSEINMNDFINFIKNQIEKYNFEIDIYKISNNQIKLTSHGVSSHAAHPDMGINAISRLIVLLSCIFKHYDENLELFDLFEKYISLEYDGKSLGIYTEDESGSLTLNVAKFDLIDGTISIGINLRIPVNTHISYIKNKLVEISNLYNNISCEFYGEKDALYVPKDNYLVKTLCKVFNEVTNSNFEPIAIGGATYARAFDNCISFGANMPQSEDMCHKANEFISIDNLLLSCKIYAKAIYELSK